MSSTKANIVFSFISQGWSAVMGLLFVPLYIKYLGMESYGLIGVFATLQAWLILLDLGLAQTLNREMARYSAGKHTPQSIRDLLRSMEVIYIIIAVLIAGLVISLAPWLSKHWLQVGKLNVDTVIHALYISGIIMALGWLGGLYRSAINGLQEQAWLSRCAMVFSTFRGFGVLGILIWVSPTIKAFFVYQGIMTGLETIVLGFWLGRLIPKAEKKAQFTWQSLHKVWHFAAGIMAITLLSLLLMQVDKVLLTRLLSLENFGYYTLAGALAAICYRVTGPISNVLGPKLSEVVARGNKTTEVDAYHRYSQLMSIAIVPTALLISFFSDHIVLLWLHNEHTAKIIAPIVTLLIIGTMLHGLMTLPYLLQLAHGWTSLSTIVNIFAVIILVPALYFSVKHYGMLGAPWIWLILNTCYAFVTLPLMHRRLLKNELLKWYLKDVASVILVVSIVLGLGRILVPAPGLSKPYLSIIILCVCTVLSFAAAAAVTSIGREFISRSFAKHMRNKIVPI